MEKKLKNIFEEAEIVRNPLKEAAYPYKNYSIYLHLVYKPIKKAKFIERIRTLNEFLRIAKRRGLEQKRSDHPIALEFRVEFSSKKPLSEDEIKDVGKAMALVLFEKFYSPQLLNYMDFGVEVSYSTKPVATVAEIRLSRDGEKFEVTKVERELRRWL